MKKLLLLLGAAAISHASMAQLSLTGTSYTQDFNNLGTALPIGWKLFTGATPAALGNDVTATKFNASPVEWKGTSGGFRNSASANGQPNFAAIGNSSTAQAAVTDRALSVRQVSYSNSNFGQSDSGAAFGLHINNTVGLTNFQLSFKLQSLDSTSTRITAWVVDYGFGSNPSAFTSVAVTGTNTTGGNTFTNNTITVNFGNALDNQSGNVWIRIAALTVSTGASGNRATTGIDDFNLTWTGSSAPNYHPNITALSPANNSINVPVATNLQVTFDRAVTVGTGSITVKNVTDQTTQTIPASAASVSGNVATITGATLALGKSYYVTFDSTVFDTAGFVSYGIYDTTAWTFSTLPVPLPPLTSLYENFDTACGATPPGLPARWRKYSVAGSQQWNCHSIGYNGTPAFAMNGYQGGNNVNEDWLITPKLDLSAMTNPAIAFRAFKKFAGDDIHVLISFNYSGIGDPTAATWTDLNIDFSTVDTNWNVYQAGLASFKSNPFFVAFKYTSTTTAAAQWKLDEIQTKEVVTSVNSISKATLPFTVLGYATSNSVSIAMDAAAGSYDVSIIDMSGKSVHNETINLSKGSQTFTISGFHLAKGMYMLKMNHGKERGVAKFLVQ